MVRINLENIQKQFRNYSGKLLRINYLSCILNLKTFLGSFIAEYSMVLFASFARKHLQYFGVRMSLKLLRSAEKIAKRGISPRSQSLSVRKQPGFLPVMACNTRVYFLFIYLLISLFATESVDFQHSWKFLESNFWMIPLPLLPLSKSHASSEPFLLVFIDQLFIYHFKICRVNLEKACAPTGKVSF